MKVKPPRCPRCGGRMTIEGQVFFCLNCGATIDPAKVKIFIKR